MGVTQEANSGGPKAAAIAFQKLVVQKLVAPIARKPHACARRSPAGRQARCQDGQQRAVGCRRLAIAGAQVAEFHCRRDSAVAQTIG